MPITIKPAKHVAKLVPDKYKSCKEPLALLEGACFNEYLDCKEIIQSSFASLSKSSSSIDPSANGFVYSAIHAYSDHFHLNISPEDVWVAIITQLSFNINLHAEELQGKFVAFEGKKELVAIAIGSRYSVDFGALAKALAVEVEHNVVDPELRE